MRFRWNVILAVAVVFLVSTAGWADLAPYSQDYEGLNQADPNALRNDGWLVFGNVFGPDWSYWYGYGPFPAPNGGAGFSGIDIGQGGSEQGEQQMVVYNDYNNSLHGQGAWIEANVFQEQTIGAADVGMTWRFVFDAKRGNIAGDTTAKAFFKTLDPNAGFALTNFIPLEMTNVPDTWDTYTISIFIDPSLEGQILQFGFLSLTTYYQPSGIFYDNVVFELQPLAVAFDARPGGCPNPLSASSRGGGVFPTAVMGAADFDVNMIDVDSLRLEGLAPVHWSLEDVGEPYDGALCGCSEAPQDGLADLTLKFDSEALRDRLGVGAGGDRVVTLTGTLLDGTPIEGQDCVIVVGTGRNKAAPSAIDGRSRTRTLATDDASTRSLRMNLKRQN